MNQISCKYIQFLKAEKLLFGKVSDHMRYSFNKDFTNIKVNDFRKTKSDLHFKSSKIEKLTLAFRQSSKLQFNQATQTFSAKRIFKR